MPTMNCKVECRRPEPVLFHGQTLLLLPDEDEKKEDNEYCFEHGMPREANSAEIDFEVLQAEELSASR